MAKRISYTDEDMVAAFERCDGEWRWREDRKRLEFIPKISSSSPPCSAAEDLRQELPPWPSFSARLTWPGLSAVWDTFGTEPETPSRQEKPPVIKACDGWLQACHAPISLDVANSRPGRVSLQAAARRSYINIPLSRQPSLISSRHLSRKDLAPASDAGSLAETIRSQPSPNLIAARLTYARQGPVTLEIVKEVAALELDLDMDSPTHDLFNIIGLKSFDEFLLAALVYSDTFLRMKDVEKRLRDAGHDSFFADESAGANSDLSREKSRVRIELEESQTQLCAHYCKMLVPGKTPQRRFHHSYAGSWRTSRTNADQMLQEGVLRYTAAVVWIALGRKCWREITGELGRLFRCQEFNISGRLAHKPSDRQIEAEYQRTRRIIVSGGPMITFKKRDTAFQRTPHLASSCKKNSPLVSSLLSHRSSSGSGKHTSAPGRREMSLPVGILGKPVLDFTPFLEPKPEVKKAKPAEDSGEESESESGSEDSDDSGDSRTSMDSSDDATASTAILLREPTAAHTDEEDDAMS